MKKKFDGEHLFFTSNTRFEHKYSCVNLHGYLHMRRNISCEDLFGRDLMRLLSEDQYDVRVDNNNYTPVSWEEVKIHLNTMIII